MGNIQVLSEQVANQIAAGEVVERPASVVKELVENAVDARSTRIEVTIEEGGLEYIRVLDNGSGMAADDCSLAFQRHATSKILAGADLFQIRTLGFRGEALPSIAAVAKVECTTATDNSGLARKIVIHGGEVIRFEECAASQGTDIQVRSLFFNTPARLKYMKTIQTELSHISDYLYRMALAHPGIAFSLQHNGQMLLQTLGNGDVLQVIAAIYGTQAARQMVAVEAQTIDYRMTGHISLPTFTRANRSGMTIVVNGRCIKNYALVQALLEAYHTLLPLHRYPLAVLHFTMDPLLVDVNVHPAKLEVRFSKERELTELLSREARAVLLKSNLVPQMIAASLPSERTTVRPREPQVSQSPQVSQPQLPLFEANERASKTSYAQRKIDQLPPTEQIREALAPPPVEPVAAGLPMMFPVGQIHGTYIVAQNEQGMFLIDQHAAHERLNYEKFMKQMANPEPIAQALLLPITITLSPSDARQLLDKLALLQTVGVYMESFGGNSFIVRAYPNWFPPNQEQALIEEMVEWLLAEKQTIEIGKLRERTAIMGACKASVKANQALSHMEMETLIEQLRACRVPFTCPHGRPIVVRFSTYDLEKMFKRVM